MRFARDRTLKALTVQALGRDDQVRAQLGLGEKSLASGGKGFRVVCNQEMACRLRHLVLLLRSSWRPPALDERMTRGS